MRLILLRRYEEAASHLQARIIVAEEGERRNAEILLPLVLSCLEEMKVRTCESRSDELRWGVFGTY